MGAHVSLFAGIGCDFLGSRNLGFTPAAHSELEPWLRKLLSQRFPRTLDLGEVKNVSGIGLRKAFGSSGTLVSGGFPCQDLSPLRGTALGLDQARSGLYRELMRVVHEAQPEYVMIENVAVLRSRGLERLLSDLYNAGYDARWDCIPAAHVGARHRRDRIFIGAVRTEDRKTPNGKSWWKRAKALGAAQRGGVFGNGAAVTRFPRSGMMVSGLVGELEPLALAGRGTGLWPTPRAAANDWRTTKNAPSHGSSHGKTLAGEVNDCERAAGRTPAKSSDSAGNINPEWVEWLMGIPGGWTDSSVTNYTLKPFKNWQNEPNIPRTAAVPDRRRRLHALGNALVPQAFELSLSRLIEW